MKLEKKKKRQEREDERWSRLNKKIKRARARHELARLVMGIIFLVLMNINIYVYC